MRPDFQLRREADDGKRLSSYWFCHPIGGLAYSVHQTSDGGYSLAGAGDLTGGDSVAQVPWLAKVDASGNLLWQHFYYQPSTTQYFSSSDLSGGFLALGFTVNPIEYLGELFAVKTDSSGLVGTCSQVHDATPLEAVDPALDTRVLALPVQTTIGASAPSPSTTRPTAISFTAGQC